MSGIGPLNLSDADVSGFDPLEPGRYNAVVHEVSMDAVKNEGGKLPVGTPMIKVQFRLEGNEDEKLNNRRVFTQYAIPPADYDAKKAATMKGMIANFFIAMGYEKDAVLTKKFDFDTAMEEVVGRECVVQVGKEQKKDRQGNLVEGEYNNPVKGVKPAGTLAGSASGSLL